MLRGLDAFLYGTYSGSRFVVAGNDVPPQVQIAACGAVLPQALAGARELADEGIPVRTSSTSRRSTGSTRPGSAPCARGFVRRPPPSLAGPLRTVFAEGVPVVTVHDGASHAMVCLGSALGAPCVPLGVDEFGQSGAGHHMRHAWTTVSMPRDATEPPVEGAPLRSSPRGWFVRIRGHSQLRSSKAVDPVGSAT